jgi:hypothetical protein
LLLVVIQRFDSYNNYAQGGGDRRHRSHDNGSFQKRKIVSE